MGGEEVERDVEREGFGGKYQDTLVCVHRGGSVLCLQVG